jgi:hypothetical protein
MWQEDTGEPVQINDARAGVQVYEFTYFSSLTAFSNKLLDLVQGT